MNTKANNTLSLNDLRIGNYVGATLAESIPLDLSEYSDFDVRCFHSNGFLPYKISDGQDIDNAKWYFPIPLSKLWLEKFGFKVNKEKGFNGRTDEHHVVLSKGGFDIVEIDDNFHLWIEIEEDTWYSYKSTKIDYVHELQNIFFSLRKKELKDEER